jgi:hypothetical protein
MSSFPSSSLTRRTCSTEAPGSGSRARRRSARSMRRAGRRGQGVSRCSGAGQAAGKRCSSGCSRRRCRAPQVRRAAAAAVQHAARLSRAAAGASASSAAPFGCSSARCLLPAAWPAAARCSAGRGGRSPVRQARTGGAQPARATLGPRRTPIQAWACAALQRGQHVWGRRCRPPAGRQQLISVNAACRHSTHMRRQVRGWWGGFEPRHPSRWVDDWTTPRVLDPARRTRPARGSACTSTRRRCAAAARPGLPGPGLTHSGETVNGPPRDPAWSPGAAARDRGRGARTAPVAATVARAPHPRCPARARGMPRLGPAPAPPVRRLSAAPRSR